MKYLSNRRHFTQTIPTTCLPKPSFAGRHAPLSAAPSGTPHVSVSTRAKEKGANGRKRANGVLGRSRTNGRGDSGATRGASRTPEGAARSRRPARAREEPQPRRVPVQPRIEVTRSGPARFGSGPPPLLKRASATPRLPGGARVETLNLRARPRNAGTCRRARLRDFHSNGSGP